MLISTQQTRPQSGNWIAHIATLTRWNLFMIRRRVISKVLALILFGLIGLAMLVAAFISKNVAQGFFGIPETPSIFGSYLNFMGPLLLCILAGSVIGSEYTFGVQRQMLARGSSRAQVFIAQILTLFILALGTTLLFLLLALLIGFTLGPVLGIKPEPLSTNQWLGMAYYTLSMALKIWIYMLITMLVATLGRSAVAGISFSLGYIVLESTAATILAVVGEMLQNDLGKFLIKIPDFLPGLAASNLVTYTNGIMVRGTPIMNDFHPLRTAIAIAYCIIGTLTLAYLVYSQRDMLE